MSEEEAVVVMQHTIAIYAQRIHQRFQWGLVSWTVEDLQQEGRLAAVLASRTFDPTRAAFPTYARIRIWGAMLDYVRRVLPGRRLRRGWVMHPHLAIEDLPGGIDWMPETRQPCTCRAPHQPCPACQAWRSPARPGTRPEAHQPGSTAPLALPLEPLEVAWL